MLVILVAGGAARADVITLLNGTEIDGEIVERTDDYIVIEVMGKRFKKIRHKIPRSQFERTEDTGIEQVHTFYETFIRTLEDPHGRKTVLVAAPILLLAPAIGIFLLSLIFGHTRREWWKALAASAGGFAAPLIIIVIIDLVVELKDAPVKLIIALLLLVFSCLSAHLLYREKPHRTALFPVVHLVSLAIVFGILYVTGIRLL
jgi:hypothetical protein